MKESSFTSIIMREVNEFLKILVDQASKGNYEFNLVDLYNFVWNNLSYVHRELESNQNNSHPNEKSYRHSVRGCLDTLKEKGVVSKVNSKKSDGRWVLKQVPSNEKNANIRKANTNNEESISKWDDTTSNELKKIGRDGEIFMDKIFSSGKNGLIYNELKDSVKLWLNDIAQKGSIVWKNRNKESGASRDFELEDSDGNFTYIEVKTTSWKQKRFYISSNELELSCKSVNSNYDYFLILLSSFNKQDHSKINIDILTTADILEIRENGTLRPIKYHAILSSEFST